MGVGNQGDVMTAAKWVGWAGICLTVGCGSREFASRAETASRRGVVVVSGPSVRAVTAGPAIIHAFSANKGGGVYFVPVATGTDADCRANARDDIPGRSRAVIQADHRFVFSVTEGELACLTTEGRGRFELLWHEYPAPRMQSAAVVQTSGR